jgi:hypothetical protein
MPCFLNFWPCVSPGVPGAVGDPRLGPVEHPLVLGLVVDGPGPQRRDVRAGVGLAHAEGAELHVLGGAEDLGDPLGHLLRGAVGDEAGHAEGRAHDREPDARVSPEQLLGHQRHGQAGGIGEAVDEEVPGVEAVLGRLLDDRPGRLLPLVPLVGGGADDVLGEVVDPLLDLELVLVQLQGEISHALQVTPQ